MSRLNSYENLAETIREMHEETAKFKLEMESKLEASALYTKTLLDKIAALENKPSEESAENLEPADIGELTRLNGPNPVDCNDKDRITEMKTEFASVVTDWSEHIGHLNRVNTGKWADFFEDIFERYPQLELILRRPKTKPEDFEGRCVDWGHVLINQKIKEVASSFSAMLTKELSSTKHKHGLPASLGDVWSILKRIHALKKESMQPVFANYVRVCSNYMSSMESWSPDEYAMMLSNNFDRRLVRFMYGMDKYDLIAIYRLAIKTGTTLQLSAALEKFYWEVDDDVESPMEQIMNETERMPGYRERMDEYLAHAPEPGARRRLYANLTMMFGDAPHNALSPDGGKPHKRRGQNSRRQQL